jgi:UTP--glucose-1-phosphate uridylyltransferase
LELLVAADGKGVSLNLGKLAKTERCLAYEIQGRRFNLDEENGLLIAQLALALDGPQRDSVLVSLLELLATSSRPA